MTELPNGNILGHLRALAAAESDEHHRLLVRFSEADVRVRLLGHQREVTEATRAGRALQRRADGGEPPGRAADQRRLAGEVAALDRRVEAAVADREDARALLDALGPEFAAAQAG